MKAGGRVHEHPKQSHQPSDSMVRYSHSILHAAPKDAA